MKTTIKTLTAAAVAASLMMPMAMTTPTMAGHSYTSGKRAFENAMREYGSNAAQGAINQYDDAKNYYDRYGRPIVKFWGGAVSPAWRAFKYRSPIPLMIVPDSYSGPIRGNGTMY